MTTTDTRDMRAERDRFLEQVQAHHRTGDYYPDPSIIARELLLTRAQTETILNDLRARGWIAVSPYDPARLRLTPRCWNTLLHASQPTAQRVAA